MWDFEHADAGSPARSLFEIGYTTPSQCAQQLGRGSADIGIVPAAALGMIPDLAVIPGVAIAARRAVRSILLVSRVPLQEIRSVGLDESSLTSVALTKILFAKWWGGSREYRSMAPKIEQMLEEHDAGLVIGDPALQIDRTRYVTYDLAEEWIRLTGKPFVFAVWAARRAALQDTPEFDVSRIFQQSRDHGLAAHNLDQVVRDWSRRLELTEEVVREYLTGSIHYFLDRACLDGLQLFHQYAEECAALPAAPALNFLDAAKAAVV